MRKLLPVVSLITVIALGGFVFVGLPALRDDGPTDASRALNAVAPSSSYSASASYYLALDGQSGGVLRSFTGGNHVGDVVEAADPEAQSGIQKAIGSVRIEPIVIEVGAGSVAPPLRDAIQRAWQGSPKPVSGGITGFDYDGKAVEQLAFTDATITKTEMPALDGANSNPAVIRVTLAPTSVRWTKGEGETRPSSTPIKNASASNFRVTFGGLPTQRVSAVSAITSTVALAPEAVDGFERSAKASGAPSFSNVHLTMSQVDSPAWASWFDQFVVKGNNAQNEERSGLVELLSQDLTTVLAKIDLTQCGIFRLANEPRPANTESVPKFSVDLYCESMAFTP